MRPYKPFPFSLSVIAVLEPFRKIALLLPRGQDKTAEAVGSSNFILRTHPSSPPQKPATRGLVAISEDMQKRGIRF